VEKEGLSAENNNVPKIDEILQIVAFTSMCPSHRKMERYYNLLLDLWTEFFYLYL